MKKMRILALIMTCAILLSSIMIPVSAEEPNNNAPAITIDGNANEDIWENPTKTYQLKYYTIGAHNNSNTDRADPQEDTEGISTVKFAYDKDYLYVCFETTNTTKPFAYFGIQIRPDANRALSPANYGSNFTGEAVHLLVHTNSTAAGITNDGTYYWKGSEFASSDKLIRAFCNNVSTSDSASQFNSNHDVYNNTEVALNIATEGTVTKRTVEIKYPLADSYKQALTTADGANLFIGLREFVGWETNNLESYFMDEQAMAWCDSGHANEGENLNLPQIPGMLFTPTVPANPTATVAKGATFTIDGKMGVEEAWSTSPLFQTTYLTNDPTKGPTGSFQKDTEPSTLRISTDGKMLYFFYETTHEGSLNLGTISNKTRPICLYFAPAGKDQAANADDATFYLIVDPTKDTLGDAVNTFSTAVSGGTSIKTTYTDKNSQNGEIAIVKEKTGDTATYFSFELAFVIPEALQTKLQTGSVDYRISVREITRVWNGQESGGTGYVFSANPVCSTSYTFTAGTGETFTLPQIPKTNDNTVIELLGFQSRVNQTDNTKYDVRFVSLVKDLSQVEQLGYTFGYGSATSTQYCTKIYKTLNYTTNEGVPGTLTAEEGQYYFCFTIMGLSKTAAGYTFDVSCFAKENANAIPVYCDNPVTVTITYNTNENAAVFQ